MAKIYVVTKGTYSDYHIITATTDYELAKKIAANCSEDWDEAKVETYEDSEMYLKPCWSVHFNKEGEADVIERNRSEWAYEGVNKLQKGGRFDNRYIIVAADTADAAAKIASEKYAQHMAKEAGIS